MIALMPCDVLTERRTNLFVGMELPLWRGQWSSLFRRFSGRNVMNQFHASATNESGVFVGRERHRWGAWCIAHAHWQPLFVGDEALVILSGVFTHLWRHTGSFEAAFPQLAPPGPAFASAMRLLA